MSIPTYPKPRLLVSQCLEFDACRYDGDIIHNATIRRLKNNADFIPVCPEVGIGLGIPRAPVRLVEQDTVIHMVQPETGKDYTDRMYTFSCEVLSELNDLDGIILKSRSPSCGVSDTKIFAKSDDSIEVYCSSGLFAREILNRFPDLPVTDEEHLNWKKDRHHFLTTVFTLAAFRTAQQSGDFEALQKFHAKYCAIYKAHDPQQISALKTILMNSEQKSERALFMLYRQQLIQFLKTRPETRIPDNSAIYPTELR